MSNKWANDENALGICDRCGLTYKLRRLKKETQNRTETNLMVCPECWDPDHPQQFVYEIDVDDPKPLLDPRYETADGAGSTSDDDDLSEFTTDAGGWVVVNGSGSVADGSITITPSGSAAYMSRAADTANQVAFDTNYVHYLRFNVLRPESGVSPSWNMIFQWRRTTDATWSATDRQLNFISPEFQGYETSHTTQADLRHQANWDGTIEGVRLWFHDDTATETVSVDYIRFEEF